MQRPLLGQHRWRHREPSGVPCPFLPPPIRRLSMAVHHIHEKENLMPEAAVAPVADPSVTPAPDPKATPAGGAPVTDKEVKDKADAAGLTPTVDPLEYELEIGGKKQKIKFTSREQLVAVLQKAAYSDRVIKEATQAKKGAEALMAKLKEPGGLKEVLSDPAIGMDYKKWAI